MDIGYCLTFYSNLARINMEQARLSSMNRYEKNTQKHNSVRTRQMKLGKTR